MREMGREWGKVWLCILKDTRYVESLDCALRLLTSSADDRFIAKELSRAELQAMETFAPAYFDYMSSAVVAHVGV